jgi:hypothetical protein
MIRGFKTQKTHPKVYMYLFEHVDTFCYLVVFSLPDKDHKRPKSNFFFQVRIFKEIASALNATYEIKQPQLGDKWEGIEADLLAGMTDIGWGHFVQTAERMHKIDLSDVFDTDEYCFLIAKPPELPR